MKPITTHELRKIQIEILKSIHNYCQENNLRYSLAYGTLLGAVRHKGFIPWDDDIDIMMPRPDYEQFLKGYRGYNEFYQVQDYCTDHSYWFSFAKVYDNRTILIEKEAKNGVYIDVFPIDGVPNNAQEKERVEELLTKIICHDLRISSKSYLFKKNKLFNYLKYIIQNLRVPARKQIIDNIHFITKKFLYGSTSNAGIIFYDKFQAIIPQIVYEEYKNIEFEGLTCKCISNTDLYLKTVYGNYMQLPPEEERVGRHNIQAYWL